MSNKYLIRKYNDKIISGAVLGSVRSVYGPLSEKHIRDLPNIETVVLTHPHRNSGIMNWHSDMWGQLKRIGFGSYEVPNDVILSECTDVFVAYCVEDPKFSSRQFPKLKRAVLDTRMYDDFVLRAGLEVTLVYDNSVPSHNPLLSSSSRIICSAEIPKKFEASSAKEIIVFTDYHYPFHSLRNLPNTLTSLQLRGIHPHHVRDAIRIVAQTLVGLENLAVVDPLNCGQERIEISDEVCNLKNLKTAYFPFLHDQKRTRRLLPETMFLEADPYDNWWE